MESGVEFERKKAAALKALAQSGIWESNYAPPMMKLFWRLGLKVRPPHFSSRLVCFVSLFLGLSLFWGGLLYFVMPPAALGLILFSAFRFGVTCAAMAVVYYHISAKYHRLPNWNDL